MSENASDCTKNAAYRDRKIKKFLGRGHRSLPHWGGGLPLPKPYPSASTFRIQANCGTEKLKVIT